MAKGEGLEFLSLTLSNFIQAAHFATPCWRVALSKRSARPAIIVHLHRGACKRLWRKAVT